MFIYIKMELNIILKNQIYAKEIIKFKIIKYY